ncbi:S8 family serine peptidase [Bacillus sp. 1P10SD]|uniref:S8 family serine peptidase n=1 Tax=Bacillus sp. 1P10SD TaxID=3132265 RepID=UPI0039A61253
MRIFRYMYILVLGLVFFFGFCQPSLSASAEENVRILVKYKNSEVSPLSIHEKRLGKIDVVKTTKDKVDRKIKELEASPLVEYAEVDQIAFTQGTVPNDPNFTDQQKVFNVLKVEEAWSNYHPTQEVVVAVIDSGVDLDHPDLRDTLVEGTNIIQPSLPPIDIDGHGTHVAGLVGATTGNGIGLSSIAKQVKIMPIKVIEHDTGYMSDVVKGILYAVDHGATIINLSLGSLNNMQALQDAIDYAESKNVLIIAAAGNEGKNQVMYPAAYEEVISVGSVDTNTLQRASFSNYGSYVDVYVPGTGIWSTFMNDDYTLMDGTSMSSGIVSSVAAMLKRQAPFLTAEQIRTLIEGSLTASGQEKLVNTARALQLIDTYQRLYGATSMETSIEISKQGWAKLPAKTLTIHNKSLTGTFVIIATADTFPDSLVAAPLATYLDSPILLVKHQQVTEELKAELQRINPDYIAVIGGENAIPLNVEAQLHELGMETVRLAGSTRYETAVVVNQAIPFATNKAFVVSGENYPDALSVASYSGKLQYPLLFTRSAFIPDQVKAYLSDKAITKTYVIGGEMVIGNAVFASLPSPHRIDGGTRFETNYNVHRTFGDEENTTLPLYFATGLNFPDALAVGPLAARTGSPVILVPQIEPESVKKVTDLFSTKNYYVLGGNQAISTETAWLMDRFLSK